MFNFVDGDSVEDAVKELGMVETTARNPLNFVDTRNKILNSVVLCDEMDRLITAVVERCGGQQDLSGFEKATLEAVKTWPEDKVLTFAKNFGIPLPDVEMER